MRYETKNITLLKCIPAGTSFNLTGASVQNVLVAILGTNRPEASRLVAINLHQQQRFTYMTIWDII